MPFKDPVKAREYRRNYRRAHPEQGRRWRLSNPGRLAHWREKDIRITLQQFENMLKEQDHKCKICGRTDQGYKKRLAVDHDHETKLIRGLLCGACNTAIGLLKDDWILFEKAANYLRSFNAK